jgi:RNA polymerase sigma-70 factor (ECF subfamily)
MSAQEVLIAGLCDEAEAAWPDVYLPRATFAAKLNAVLAETGTTAATDLYHVDLYLAVACSAGDPAAIAAFSRRYLENVAHYVRRFADHVALFDEVRAQLEDKLLFAAEAGHPPRIAQYAGRGPLEAWVALAAQRSLLSMLRARGSVSRSDPTEGLWEVWTATADLERDLSQRYAETIKEALRLVVQSLPVRQRMILRLSIVEDVSLSQIARMLKVNQSTISRTFHLSLDRVNEELRTKLKAIHGMRDSEVESVVRELRSRIDLSLSGVFADPPELAQSLGCSGALHK